MRVTYLVGLATVIASACHPGPAPRRVEVQTDWAAAACDTPLAPTFRRAAGGLNPATRDSLLQDLERRRATWQTRHLTTYRLRVVETCFCPLAPPGVVEVRDGIVVAAFDTAGRSAPALVSRLSSYTVEGLFNAIERTLRSGELLEVSYEPCLGFPTALRGNMRMVDSWFQIAAGPLTRPR